MLNAFAHLTDKRYGKFLMHSHIFLSSLPQCKSWSTVSCSIWLIYLSTYNTAFSTLTEPLIAHDNEKIVFCQLFKNAEKFPSFHSAITNHQYIKSQLVWWTLTQGSYPFLETNFQDFSRTFQGPRSIFEGL